AGSVRIDGRDVRDYELANLRAQIAVVTQDVVLFDDTIRNNIAFGRQVPHADIERAAQAAHVLEFVRDQPGGLDALVGERGVLLSGGQRQRIAIARALLKDAPILILDEATSALDTEAERHIQAALAQLLLHRTTFIIAHRLSTVEQADRIIVLAAGAIVERGRHRQDAAHHLARAADLRPGAPGRHRLARLRGADGAAAGSAARVRLAAGWRRAAAARTAQRLCRRGREGSGRRRARAGRGRLGPDPRGRRAAASAARARL